MEDDPAATGPEEFNSNSVCIACCKDLSGRIECHRLDKFYIMIVTSHFYYKVDLIEAKKVPL